jgi:nitroreductase
MLESLPAVSVFDAIYGRRAVRSYKEDKLEVATVRRLLEAAVQAPTAIRVEPWVFAVIQDRAVLRSLSDRGKSLFAQEMAQRAAAGGVPSASRYRELLADPEFNIFYDAGTLIADRTWWRTAGSPPRT